MLNIFNSQNKKINSVRGFTLIEVLVSVAVFVIISAGVYAGFISILKTMSLIRIKGIMTNIANEQFEIARNLPYANVGTVEGIPSGVLPQNQTITRDGKMFNVDIVVRNFDDPFDGTFDGTPKDLSPADMKIIETTISCPSCGVVSSPVSFTTKIAPKNLETASTNGAIVVKVFDASGFPVPEANVNIINNNISPTVNLNDKTDINGILTIVDAPPSVDGYQIIVSKENYSTDRTYASGQVANPNPTKPNITVVVQQISQISFTIDRLSTITISTLNSQCVPTPNFNFNIKGSKLIGTNPDVSKYNQDFETNSSGLKNLSDIEWDTYNILGLESDADIVGTNPLLSLGINPGSDQTIDIITAPKSGRRLLVVVRDQSTGLPIPDATVELFGPNDYYQSIVTDEGYINQTDWYGGDGQIYFESPNMYFDSDNNIDVSTYKGGLVLKNVFGHYVSSGYLTSSTFDIGSGVNFKQMIWSPVAQPEESGQLSIKFQIATNNDKETWRFVGPEDTEDSFYTTLDQDINPIHNGDRYFRYRVFLSTENDAFSPIVSDISFTYASLCVPPGQVYFSNLDTGSYLIRVNHSKYKETNKEIQISENWHKEEVVISP